MGECHEKTFFEQATMDQVLTLRGQRSNLADGLLQWQPNADHARNVQGKRGMLAKVRG